MNAAQKMENDSAKGDRSGWSYEEAFSRNLGLISHDDQRRLRDARVAIIGMGGVGGVHLATLARLGIGRFTIADPDVFTTVNFNRQYGAMLRNLGRGKADAMAAEARQINPDLDLRVFSEPVTASNVGEFLEDATVLVDGVDFFEFDMCRLVFREMRRRGRWGLTAGPLGFSAAWLLFDPQGMDFDTYCDMRDGMDPLDQAAAYAIALAPAGTHWPYLDLSQVDMKATRGPSAGLACQLCSGIAAAETAKIILGRKPLRGPLLRPIRCLPLFASPRPFTLGQSRTSTALETRILRRRMVQLGYGK